MKIDKERERGDRVFVKVICSSAAKMLLSSAGEMYKGTANVLWILGEIRAQAIDASTVESLLTFELKNYDCCWLPLSL